MIEARLVLTHANRVAKFKFGGSFVLFFLCLHYFDMVMDTF